MKANDYTVSQVRNLDRITVKQRSGGNTVVVKYIRGGANALYTISDLKYIYNSGSEISADHMSGFENVEFPFHFKLSFTAPSKLRKKSMTNEDSALDINREAEIVINKPGNWEIIVSY